jgi:hypothetical protein
MECLDNYIGVRSLVEQCGADPSKSRLYLEDLEGLTIGRIADIESGKTGSASKLFNQLLQRAGRQMMEEVKILLTPYWRTESAIEGGRLGSFQNTLCDDAELTIESHITPLSALVITEISVKVDYTGTITITLEDGSYTETKDVEVVAGVEKFVPWQYTAKTATVKFTTPHKGYAGSLHGAWRMRSRSCPSAPYLCICCNSGKRRTCGISATFAVQCLPERFLCESLPHLNYPLLYSLGIEVLKEWEASDRLNFLAVHGKEWAFEKRQEWEQKRNEFINASVVGIARYLERIDRKCFTCGGYSYGWAHP